MDLINHAVDLDTKKTEFHDIKVGDKEIDFDITVAEQDITLNYTEINNTADEGHTLGNLDLTALTSNDISK